MVTRWSALAALFVDAAIVLVLAGSLPAFAAAFRVRQDVAGLVFTASGTGFVAAVPVAGFLADRFGKRATLAAGAAGVGLALLLFAASRSLAQALAAAAAVGACGGTVESGVTALMPELYPGREGFANNFAQAFFGAGAAVGPLLLLWGGLSWRLRLAAGSAAFLLLAAVLWAQRRHDRPALLPSPGPRRDLPIPTRRTAKGPRGSGPLRLLAAPGLAAAAGAMLLYTGVEVALWDWLFAVVTRPGGAGPAWAVAELSGFWVAMGAGRLWTAALAERVSLPLLITAGCALGIVALPLALLAPTPAGDLAAGVLCGLAFAGIWPSLVALGQRRCGQSALVSSVLVASGGAGALAIPAAFGFGAARLGLGPAAVALAALLVPVAILPWATPAPPGSGPADRPVLAPGAGPSGATGTG